MNKVKEIIDEISSLDSLKSRKITKFIQGLELEKYGLYENRNYLSTKIEEIIREYDKNGQD